MDLRLAHRTRPGPRATSRSALGAKSGRAYAVLVKMVVVMLLSSKSQSRNQPMQTCGLLGLVVEVRPLPRDVCPRTVHLSPSQASLLHLPPPTAANSPMLGLVFLWSVLPCDTVGKSLLFHHRQPLPNPRATQPLQCGIAPLLPRALAHRLRPSAETVQPQV